MISVREKIKAEISQNKRNAEAIAQKNKAIAMSCPAYFDADKLERKLSLEASKEENMLGKVTEKTQNDLENAKNLKKNALKSINLTENDLVPNYTCKHCNDTGITTSGPCECFKKKLAYYTASVNEVQKFASFEDFNLTGTNEDSKQNLLKIKNFLINFSTTNNEIRTILLCGKTGVGKTFLGECTLNEFEKNEKSVFKVSAFAMNELFTKFHFCYDYNKADYLDCLLTPDVLMIDDLGTEPIKRNVTKEYLYLLLSERENKNKKTIITTNLDLEDILKIYEERIFSRLANKRTSKKILISGNDRRLS